MLMNHDGVGAEKGDGSAESGRVGREESRSWLNHDHGLTVDPSAVKR